MKNSYQKLFRILFIPLALVLSFQVMAQERTVSGRITSAADGEGIPGVNVLIKGTSLGSVTDFDGNFRVPGVSDASVLVISFIGYVSQEITVGSRTQINVVMEDDVTALEEVVVIGYGTIKKSDVTGAVSSVKESDFNKGVYAAPTALLQGKAAGVNVFSNDGTPGGATTVRIRGNSSVRSGSQPLYVVDGVALDGRSAKPGLDAQGIGGTTASDPLNFINPNDIASMEVLKDASATAIYGSRGANGVILITTKKGLVGAPEIHFSASLGVANMANSIDILNADEYRQALADYGLSGGNGDFGGESDAMDYITQTAVVQNYNMSIGAGNDKGRYRVSFGYLDQPGIIKTSKMTKYNYSANGSYEFVKDRFDIDFNVNGGVWDEDAAPITNNAGFTGDLIGQALQWNPTRDLFLPNGQPDIELGSTTINPAGMLAAYSDNTKVSNVLVSIAPSVRIVDNLVFKFQMSLFNSVGNRAAQILGDINVQGVEGRGWAQVGSNQLTTQLYTSTLSYDKEISQKLDLNFVVGYEYQQYDNKGNSYSGQDFLTDDVPYTNVMWNSAQNTRNYGGFTDPSSKLQSMFARVNFNISDKYLITGTFRADGSSKFGTNNRYAYFPSGAFKWNLSNEGFLESSSVVDALSVRIGWGQTGNQDFPSGAAQERYGLGNNGVFSGLVNVANPDLKWETSTTLNIGVDFAFVGARLTGSIDYFNKATKDLLFNFETIQPAPAGRYWKNLDGTLVNSGVEIGLNGLVMSKGTTSITLGVNLSFLDNVLNDYDGPAVLTGNLDGQGISNTTVQRLATGHPVNAFYLREWNGLDESGFDNLTDDGNSFYFIGDPNPNTLLGFNFDLISGNWSFVMNFYGAFGHEIYNNTANTVLPIGNLGSRNIAKAIVDADVQENAANSIKASTRYLESGNYFKMSNFALSYAFGDLGLIRNFRLSLMGQNLFTITKYTGSNPEVNTDKSRNGVPSFGIEYTAYPTPRTFTLGVMFGL